MHLSKKYVMYDGENIILGNKKKIKSKARVSFLSELFFSSKKELKRNCRIIKFHSVLVFELKMLVEQREVKKKMKYSIDERR